MIGVVQNYRKLCLQITGGTEVQKANDNGAGHDLGRIVIISKVLKCFENTTARHSGREHAVVVVDVPNVQDAKHDQNRHEHSHDFPFYVHPASNAINRLRSGAGLPSRDAQLAQSALDRARGSFEFGGDKSDGFTAFQHRAKLCILRSGPRSSELRHG
jgi:hypothetical protein